MMTLIASDELHGVVAGFDTLLERTTKREDSFDAAEAWAGVAAGGWLDVGAQDNAYRLTDLVEFAFAWGRHAIPLPYTSTLLARRWIDVHEAAADARLTFCFGRPGQPGLVPFGGAQGTVCLGPDGSELAAGVDTFAATLPLGRMAVCPSYQGDLLHEAAVLYAAEALGGARTALDRAIEYAGYRRAYGQEIGRFQAVKHILADAFVQVEIGRGGLVQATQEPDSSVRTCTGVAQRSQTVVEAAIQVFGGIGFTWELGVHEHYRHALAVQKLLSFG
jgi:hypothetical protein